MFKIQQLTRKSNPKFTIKPLVKRNLSPVEDRSSFINLQIRNGASYAQAIRSWDTKARQNA